MLELYDGRKLLYNDSRKFGRLELWPHAQEHIALAGLGPEPLSPEFTLAVLTTNLSTRKRPIKAVLLDQEIVAGLGNIYADEALYMAAIHPLRPANGLFPDELLRLHTAIVEVLASSIAYGGTTFSGYRGLQGELGANYEHLQAYHRSGEEKRCQRCGNVITSQVIAQRTAHFCPVCQTLT
jgi:formamidopyrimidine-DNA glycosylase